MKNGLIVDSNGTQRYYKNNQLHRADGPAFVSADGTQEWYLNGKLHREDGPALIWKPDNIPAWYLDGFSYSFKHYTDIIFPEDSPEKTLFILKWSGS